MIMIWNRKEIFVGTSSQRFNEVRDILSSEGINYTYKVEDGNSSSVFGTSNSARTGTLGINLALTKTYYIYVHKKEYDKAGYVLRNQHE